MRNHLPCKAQAVTGAPWALSTKEVIAAAAARAAEGTEPDGDTYASAAYKRHVAGVEARKAIAEAVRRAVG
jgi:carbon-monoxide dehydrogenase medium subunit